MFILTRFIKLTRPTKKLLEKYLDPFKVIGKLGTYSYLIKLRNHLCAIHPVFYVLQIEPAPLSNVPNRINPPPPPIEINSNLEFEVAQILNSKLDQQRRDPLLYLVQWSGYEGTPDEYSWMPAFCHESWHENFSFLFFFYFYFSIFRMDLHNQGGHMRGHMITMGK